MTTAPPALTGRFPAAVAFAQEVHGEQLRAGTEIPYTAHLLVVTGLVLEDGGDEDQRSRRCFTTREEGQALWDRFPHRSAREQLWYYSGLVEFFARRRPGPLTEDLRRAVGELAWLAALDPILKVPASARPAPQAARACATATRAR
jgi:hypothetical protein